MKNMFKIFAVILLGLSVVSYELFSPSYWKRVNERWEEKGLRCYEKCDRNVCCEDKDGNRF